MPLKVFLPPRVALRLLYGAVRLLFRLLYGDVRIRVSREVWGNGEPYYLAAMPGTSATGLALLWSTRLGSSSMIGQAVAGADHRQTPVGVLACGESWSKVRQPVQPSDFRGNPAPRIPARLGAPGAVDRDKTQPRRRFPPSELHAKFTLHFSSGMEQSDHNLGRHARSALVGRDFNGFALRINVPCKVRVTFCHEAQACPRGRSLFSLWPR